MAYPFAMKQATTTCPDGTSPQGKDGGLPVKRFGMWLVNLDLTVGSEIQKTRPAIVVSPDERNQRLRTAIVVALTKGKKHRAGRLR